MDIADLKKKLADARKAELQHQESWKGLAAKHQDIKEQLTTFDGELTASQNKKDEVLLRLAKSHATKADVEKARAAFDQIKAKRDDVADLLAVVEKELYSVPQPQTTGNPFYQAVKQAETALWRAIFNAERDSLREAFALPLARAYAAWLNTDPCHKEVESFLKDLFDHDTTYGVAIDAEKCSGALLDSHN